MPVMEGKALLFADVITDSISRAVKETNRRREIQNAYNLEHGLTPESVRSHIHDVLSSLEEGDYVELVEDMETPAGDLEATVKQLEKEMMAAAAELEFERAAELRDRIQDLNERRMKLGTMDMRSWRPSSRTQKDRHKAGSGRKGRGKRSRSG